MSYFPEGLGALPESLGESTAVALGMTRSSMGVTQLIWASSRSTAHAWPSRDGNRGPSHRPPLDIRLFSLFFHVSDWSDCTVLSHPPLVCFPSWHCGKCHGVHSFCECSWNGCMLMLGSCMGGLSTLSLMLRVRCWLHSAVSHQAVWHTESYSEVPSFFFPTFKVSLKALTQGDTNLFFLQFPLWKTGSLPMTFFPHSSAETLDCLSFTKHVKPVLHINQCHTLWWIAV